MGTSIYIGKNDKKLGLRRHQIFTGELPMHVADALKANPGLANLFLSFDEFVRRTPPGAAHVSSVAKVSPRQGPPIKHLK